MPNRGSTLEVTTVLLIAAGLFVIYLRSKGRLESNLPLLFFAAAITYANAVEGKLQPWLAYFGLALALFLRFEFMNRHVTFFVKVAEYAVVGLIVYDCTATILRW